jgi:pSer/pThr/pTyr-binding forkhead associated (FHA) protein
MGRDRDADIGINEEGVSRRHAAVWSVGSNLFVEDLGSRNGTFVQGRRIRTWLLESGDYVFLGGLPIRVTLGVSRSPER